jgi:hypothetical protein
MAFLALLAGVLVLRGMLAFHRLLLVSRLVFALELQASFGFRKLAC